MEISTPQIEELRAQIAQKQSDLATLRTQMAALISKLSDASAQERLLLNRVKVGLEDVAAVAPVQADVSALKQLVREMGGEIGFDEGEIGRISGELNVLEAALAELVLIEELRELSRDANVKADAFNAARLDAAAALMQSLETLKASEMVYRGVQSQIATVAGRWIDVQPGVEGKTAYAGKIVRASELFAVVKADGTDTRNSRLALPHDQMFAGRLPISDELTHALLSNITQVYLEKASEI